MKIMENKEKELEVEIKGYGCDDDCEQYFEKTASKNCGWKETDNTWPLWQKVSGKHVNE